MQLLRIACLTLFFIVGLIGCSCPEQPAFFDITGLGLTVYKYHQSIDSFMPEEKDLRLVFGKFYIKVDFTLQYYGAIRPKLNPYAAYALTCEQRGERGTNEKIDRFSIIALTDFDEQYLQGDTINDLFSVGLYSRMQQIPLQEWAADTSRIYYRGFSLDLLKRPTKLPVQFRIDMLLSTGEHYWVNTSPLFIQ